MEEEGALRQVGREPGSGTDALVIISIATISQSFTCVYLQSLTTCICAPTAIGSAATDPRFPARIKQPCMLPIQVMEATLRHPLPFNALIQNNSNCQLSTFSEGKGKLNLGHHAVVLMR